MIALIPARGGSKGILRKNLRVLHGKPLIAWTIACACKSRAFETVIVSTDDEQIAAVSKEHGAEVPFLRPSHLATDESPAIETYIYTARRLGLREFTVLLPTAPLRLPEDISAALDIFQVRKADSVISVTEASHPPQWSKRIDENGVLSDYFPNGLSTIANRQLYPRAYIPNGAIYVFKLSLLELRRSYYSEQTYAYIMPKERAFDIDQEIDLEVVEWLMRKAVTRESG